MANEKETKLGRSQAAGMPGMYRRLFGSAPMTGADATGVKAVGREAPVAAPLPKHGSRAERRYAKAQKMTDAVDDPRPTPKAAPDRLTVAKAALSKAETKNKGGRPKKVAPNPWDEEGISRAAWYRQQKAKAPKP